MGHLTDWRRGFRYILVQVRSLCIAVGAADWDSILRIVAGQAAGFHDPTTLTKWARVCLYAYGAVAVVRGCAGALGLFGGWHQQSPIGGTVWWAITIAVTFATVLLLPAWTYCAIHNARVLGASGMTFTPGSAVVCYFIPPGFFWKPYQAMKEIWQASIDPTDWKRQRGSPLLGWWWALWLAAAWGGELGYWVATLTLEEAHAQSVGGAIGLVRTVIRIPLALVLIRIITKVHRMQMALPREQAGAPSGD